MPKCLNLDTHTIGTQEVEVTTLESTFGLDNAYKVKPCVHLSITFKQWTSNYYNTNVLEWLLQIIKWFCVKYVLRYCFGFLEKKR